MAHETVAQKEKVLDLGGGKSLWRTHLDALREQDQNARVMSAAKFERLVENVRREKGLESLPLCVLQKNKAGNKELAIISGHHRCRAARAAGLSEIHVIVIDRKLSRSEVVAKQLAHNALAGDDDPQVLAQLYDEIETIDAKLESGLLADELNYDASAIPVDELALAVEHELVFLMFLPRQYERFEQALSLLEADAQVCLAEYDDFDRFKEVARRISERENVRNTAAIVARMVDVVLERYGD